MNPYAIPSIVATCIMTVVGTWVFTRDPRNPTNRVYTVISACVVGVLIGEIGLLITADVSAALRYTRLICIFGPILPALCLHFLLLFPTRNRITIERKYLISLLYIPWMVLVAILIIKPTVIDVEKTYWGFVMVTDPLLLRWRSLYYVGFLACGLYILMSSCLRAKSELVKTQTRFVIYGLTTVITLGVLTTQACLQWV